MRIIYQTMLVLLVPFISNAQFTTNVNAVPFAPCDPGWDCFRLTSAALGQKGSTFKNAPVNLTTNFVINAKLYFGTFDGDGADGIAFVVQREAPTYIGNLGAGMGYHRFCYDVPGPVPSLIFEFDTWQNGIINGGNVGDPVADHVAYQKNSDAYHTIYTNPCGTPSVNNNLQAPTALSANIEDGLWHDAKFTWTYTNATTQTLAVEFKTTAAITQNFSYTGNLISVIGGNDAFFGFTASTGEGSSFTGNEQRVAIQQPEPPGCGAGKTVTMGGWGAPARGNNPGAYRDANFASAFPNGVTIGLPGRSAKWTTAAAVEVYLPAGGVSTILPTGDLINPTTDQLKKTVAGQILALSLSMGFDAADPNFSPSATPLSNYIIANGPHAGWTVGAFLSYANGRIGSVAATQAQIDAVNETATAINENFDNGANNGFLNCPTAQRPSSKVINAVAQEEKLSTIVGQAYPNPSRGKFQYNLSQVDAKAQILVINSNGVVVERRMAGNAQTFSFDLNKYGSGLYMLKVVSGNKVKTTKVIVQN